MRIEIDMSGKITEHDDAPIVLPTEAQILAKKVVEAKSYLSNTDYKDLPRYVSKADEDIEAIYRLRDEVREFIRLNDVSSS